MCPGSLLTLTSMAFYSLKSKPVCHNWPPSVVSQDERGPPDTVFSPGITEGSLKAACIQLWIPKEVVPTPRGDTPSVLFRQLPYISFLPGPWIVVKYNWGSVLHSFSPLLYWLKQKPWSLLWPREIYIWNETPFTVQVMSLSAYRNKVII